ncbi:hypothetical protein BCR35DRAFT_299401 [Leucosporidium creatinivorum]|uniref:Uncharacterized protein n=1 Tax=Leucosporidium creatinivorum TaxID=106004 RepID=A0A1Y2G2Z1_9BASI|nr:hypothetical protein BCR35DRAFT_299401 [Leucosporidium creatinivorum]
MTAAATAVTPTPTEVAQPAVAQTASPATTCFTPSLNSILTAFQKDGNNDTELLKVILRAKEKEDERLAADAILKAEQLKVQHTLVLSQVYYAQVQQQAAYAASYAPYSPTSPPSESSPTSPYASQSHLHPCPPNMNGRPPCADRRGSSYSPPPHPFGVGANAETAKRARAASSVSTSSAGSSVRNMKEEDSSGPATKKARRTSNGKPSHEDVMAALRSKCEHNQRQSAPAGAPTPHGWSSVPHPPPQQQRTTPSPSLNAKRPLAPRPPSPASSSTANHFSTMPPPPTVGRMTSRSPPLRHSAFFAPRPAPTTTTSAKLGAETSATRSTSPEEERAADSLKMLFDAGAAVEAEHPTSDVRSA